MNPKLKAIFWDVDGTIADNEFKGHRLAFNKAFKHEALEWQWDDELYLKLLSVSGGANRIAEYADKIKLSLSSSQIRKIHNTKQNFYNEIVNSGLITLRYGVKRCMHQFKNSGISQYIVTTSSIKAVKPLLKTNNIYETINFDGFITSEDVNRSKPHPEAFLKAISLSGLANNEILVIEDSLNGLLAAQASGLKCMVTLSPWLKKPSKDHLTAFLVLNHLGSDKKAVEFFKGQPSKNKIIDLEYLLDIF